jgi:hypothetical protein
VLTSSGPPTGTCTAGDTDIDLASGAGDGEVYSCTTTAGVTSWTDSSYSIQGPAGPSGTSSSVDQGIIYYNWSTNAANTQVLNCTLVSSSGPDTPSLQTDQPNTAYGYTNGICDLGLGSDVDGSAIQVTFWSPYGAPPAVLGQDDDGVNVDVVPADGPGYFNYLAVPTS